MPDIEFAVGAANIPLLDQELRAELGKAMSGVSYTHGVLRVHFVNPPTSGQRLQAEGVIAAHDPDALTPGQAQARQQEQVALQAMTDLAENWKALTTEQQLEAVRSVILALAGRELNA